MLFCLVAVLFSLEIKDEVSFVYKNDKVQIYLNLDENSTKGHIFYDNKEHVFNAENFKGSEVNLIYDDDEKVNINFVYDGLIFEKGGVLQSLKLYKKFNFLALNSIFDNGSNVKIKYSKNLLFQGDKKTIENELKSSYKEELDYFLEFVSDLQDDFPFTYETEEKMEIYYTNDNFNVFENFFYNYNGGAHGMYSLVYETFYRGKKITLDEILVKNEKLRLKIWDKVKENAYIEKNEFEITENFKLNPYGITFVYAPYEIAPYSFGSPKAFFTFDEISEFLKDEFKDTNLFL